MTTTSSRTGLDRFFEATNNSSFQSSPDKAIAGVSGAVAQRLGVAPKIVRIAAVVLAFFGPMVAIYLLAWLLLPDTSRRTVLDRAIRGGQGSAIALTVITGLVVLSDLGIRLKFFWPMLIVGGIVAVVMMTSRKGSGRGGAGGYHGSSAYGTQAHCGPQGPQDAPRW